MMSSVVAQAHFTFGLRREVANNICFFDDQTIIFPSGNNCVTYNIDQKWQRFIPGTEKSQGMQAIALSSNRRYLAVSESSEKGTITVYDLRQEQSRKRKVLSGGDLCTQEFVCLAFSTDSKYLIGQSGGPDWIFFYWMWEKQRLMATFKAGGITNPIHQISFNPQVNTEICVTGNGVFKFLRYTEGMLKPTSFPKLESHNFLSHAWMSAERVIVGTDTGRLLVLDSGDLRWETDVTTNVSTKEAKGPHESKKQNDSDMAEACDRPRVTSIAVYSRGFACSAGKGMVCLFEKTEEKDNYMKTREILIPEDPFSNDPSQAQRQEVNTLCISPSEEVLAASTDAGQLYSIALSSAEMSKGEQAHFDFLTHHFHSGMITGLSICIRKPLIATCSLDHSVRIWNYESNTLELYKGFQEEPYSIALHPFGLFILVGFSDKLRLMNLLTNDIRTYKEFTIRGCRECAFSHGGHLFAAVNGNIIHIYSSTTFENTLNLKGHNGKVRAVTWSVDDSRLMSCGMDGAVYEWNTLNSKRETESVLKSCSYTSITISPDAKTIFSVGNDCTLKEIQNCQILREVPAENVVYTAVTMSHSGRGLFVGTSAGTIRAIKYPLSAKNSWTEYQGHAAPVTKMAFTFDDQFLLTVSEDNCLLIWKLTDKEGRGLKRDKEVQYAEEILITKYDLEEKNQMLVELKTRVEELNIEKEYQLRMKDMNYNEKIKELTEKFVQQMEVLQTKNQVLKAEKEKHEIAHQQVMREMVEKHSKELQDLESNNNKKLMLEYEKYQELLVKTQNMEEEYEQKLRSVEENKIHTLEELTQHYESKLKENLIALGQRQDESRQQLRDMEECIKQIEEDGDREILDIRLKYERKLKEEKESNLRFMGEIGVMRKKFTSMQEEIDNRNLEIKKMKAEQQKLQDVIRSLEKDILGLRKEIQKRDESIQDKEMCISNLTKKNQELEKFNFVLDYKIKDLRKQIEPRENEIKEMKEQVQEMENELEQSQKQITQLKLNITELKEKLRATKLEMDKETRKVQNMEALLRRLKTDLHNCVGHIQEPRKLKESIRKLYHCYVQQSDVVDIVEVDADIQKEMSRQREHLERTVASLKKKLSMESHVQHTESVKMMKENVSLIREINDLRRELKTAHTQLSEYKRQGNLGTNRRQSYSVSKDLTTDGTAPTGVSTLNGFKEEVETSFLLQHDKVPQLHRDITAIEMPHTLRPLSATRPHRLQALSTGDMPVHHPL